MTESQKRQVREYYEKGYGYKRIAKVLNLSRDQIRWTIKSEKLTRGTDLEPLKTEIQKACIICGESFCSTSNNTKYCSKECKALARSKPNQLSMIPCKKCGSMFIPKEKIQVFCSARCRIENKKVQHDPIERFCKYCGERIDGKYGRIFCSTKCGKAYRRSGRRYRLYPTDRFKEAVAIDKTVKLYTLIKRDNNECQICKCKCDLYDYIVTPSGAMIVGKKYPTIDHIIPCVLGGSHTWDNVQLACFECNSKKREYYDGKR